MDGSWLRDGIWVLIPAEERPEIEVLNDRKLGQDFGYIHLDHTLIDLGPACSNARNVIKHWGVLPEGALLDIVNEADGREVHIPCTLSGDDCGFGNICWVGGARERSFDWSLVGFRDGWSILGAAE